MATEYRPDPVTESTTSGRKNAGRKRTAKVTHEPPADQFDQGLRRHKRMAHRFAQMFRNTFMHTPGRGWLEFNGYYWVECGESRPWNAVHSVCMQALAELPSIKTVQDRDALFEDVRMCDTAVGTAGVLKHAMHWPKIGRRDDELDRHEGLFVVQNGTYDLYAGVFRPSDPADLMTLAGDVRYDPGAQCLLYDELLELYQPDPTIRNYLHRLGGAAMEGRQNLQQLIINYGATGGNGKGTVQRAWMHVFGSYGHVLPVEAMLARRGYDQYKDEKAQLKGKRLVYLTEPSVGQRFDTGTVKSLTGGDRITSRAVYKASVTFDPTWLVMMATNNRVSTPSDGGMARRLKEIGWTYTVEDGKARDDLDDLLRQEGSGILNHLIAGWHAYLAGGIQEPDTVKQATTEYLASVDPIAQFEDECVIKTEGTLSTPSASMYAAYERWCQDNGEKAMAARLFSPELQRRGYVKKSTNKGNLWAGVGLVAKENDRW